MKVTFIACRLTALVSCLQTGQGQSSMPRQKWASGQGLHVPLSGVTAEDLPPCAFLCFPSLPVSSRLSSHLTALSLFFPLAWIREEGRCSSSEDDTDVDVEGLRRRRGREAGAPQPVAPLAVETQAGGEGAGGELGISLNMCLLGALVLLGLGVLLFSGEWYL